MGGLKPTLLLLISQQGSEQAAEPAGEPTLKIHHLQEHFDLNFFFSFTQIF